jgi:hypothetical protein
MGLEIVCGPAVLLSAQRAHTRVPLGNYRLVDRDYWIDVAETLDEAMDLPIPDGASSLIDARLHTALNYLHSFPSLRCHLNLRSDWYGEDTLALTDQWGRDGVDAAQEGLLIEYWLNELREIIRIIPLCVD